MREGAKAPTKNKEVIQMKKFETFKEVITADTDKDVVELAVESKLFSIIKSDSEETKFELDEKDATDQFWLLSDELKINEENMNNEKILRKALKDFDYLEEEYISLVKWPPKIEIITNKNNLPSEIEIENGEFKFENDLKESSLLTKL